MKDTEKELKAELSRHFVVHGQRMVILTKLVFALLELGTVSYSKWSKVLHLTV